MAVEHGSHTAPVDARRGLSRNLIDEEQPCERLSERQIGGGREMIRERLPVDSAVRRLQLFVCGAVMMQGILYLGKRGAGRR